MFNMGFTEIIVLGVIALLFIGPKQLPELARTVAKLINEFKRATSGITDVVNDVRGEAKNFTQGTENLVQESFKAPMETVEKPKEKTAMQINEPIAETTQSSKGQRDE